MPMCDGYRRKPLLFTLLNARESTDKHNVTIGGVCTIFWARMENTHKHGQGAHHVHPGMTKAGISKHLLPWYYHTLPVIAIPAGTWIFRLLKHVWKGGGVPGALKKDRMVLQHGTIEAYLGGMCV
jgi:hypothetical protein